MRAQFTYTPVVYKHCSDVSKLCLQHLLDSWYIFPCYCICVWKLRESRNATSCEPMRVKSEVVSVIADILYLDLLVLPNQIGFALVVRALEDVAKYLERSFRFIQRRPFEELNGGKVHCLKLRVGGILSVTTFRKFGYSLKHSGKNKVQMRPAVIIVQTLLRVHPRSTLQSRSKVGFHMSKTAYAAMIY